VQCGADRGLDTLGTGHALTLADGCLARNEWVCGECSGSRRVELLARRLPVLRQAYLVAKRRRLTAGRGSRAAPGRCASMRGMPADDPFVPHDVVWTPVSPRLATARRLVAAASSLLLAAALLTAGLLLDERWVVAAAVLPVLLAGWEWWLIGRQVRAIRYAERADDLLIARGVLLRSLVVVPYGRMQFVDVSAGPLDRALGIARVQLHTASPGTDASIPGLVPEQASRLRETLARRGEARLAGL